MSAPVISYQEGDLVYTNSDAARPAFPQFVVSHSLDGREFLTTEDTPLNKRHFIYQPCAPNPLLTQMKYCTSEYPYECSGINTMDRSDMLAMEAGSNDCVSVPASCGWRSGRCDVCLKEGMVYWEIELLAGGASAAGEGEDEKKNHQQALNSTPHVRFGIGRRECSLDTPVGCDFYGYGIRDNQLESVHDGKLSQVLPPTRLKPGDRIGLLLMLPSFDEQYEQAMEYTSYKVQALSVTPGNSEFAKKRNKSTNKEFQKALLRNHDPKNIIRDHIAIRYKNQLFFESTDYVRTTKPEYYTSDNRRRADFYQLKGSYLKVFLNGKELGNAFEGLQPFLPPFSELNYNEKFYMNHWKFHSEAIPSRGTDRNSILKNKYTNNGRLGYYPMVSCFNGGVVRIITRKSELKYWNFAVNEGIQRVHTLEELHQQQTGEDIALDIIDELELEAIYGSLKS
ncbi:AER231Wp [Eremothecium gossypii ATCC 10895]|uniref:AER231Wp n=1 Tax=Eremothecium gossypii (strain ATCC 10895 / CBS 109.51 / FGSC 9923 / NRRL Y-1056) TaxID=284811 RepID=Q756M3_EREGS|nr:AER231Wp [Eremothecium gossypii ATCC 10895]AAS52912.1 AER231Wp [Eremothecium gossypii ATCC 10895]AEY97220.1 FAER231Wp [Eremothecium gossypii FDAG1]